MEQGNAIDREAAQWVARGHAGLSASEQAAFETWRAADPRHSGSYLRALAIEKLAVQAAQGELPVPVSAPVATAADAVARPSRRRFMAGAMAAGVAAIAGLSTHMLSGAARIAAERGEIRNVALSDGSAAILNSGSTIAVAMQPDRRVINLVTGDAWFDVAHDKARPFEVRHGAFRVRAVGTAFQVSARADGMEVTVTEGRVAVLQDGRDASIATLSAGDRLTVGKAGLAKERLDATRIQQHLAWQQGMIVLDGDLLGEAVDNVNRYNETQIRIDSPHLLTRRVYGTFRTRDPEGLAAALAVALDARVDQQGADIVLTDAQPSAHPATMPAPRPMS